MLVERVPRVILIDLLVSWTVADEEKHHKRMTIQPPSGSLGTFWLPFPERLGALLASLSRLTILFTALCS